MQARIHIPDDDPYVRLRALLGGEPQVLLHGDDLGADASTIATWTGRRSSANGSGIGSPTVDADGWLGGGGVGFKCASLNGTSQGVGFDAAAAAYSASTPLTWIVACNLTASASARSLLSLTDSASTSHRRGFGPTATSDVIRFRSIISGVASNVASAVAAPEGAQTIYGVTFDGSNVRAIMRTNAGETVLINDLAHTGTGTLTINAFTMGFARGSSGAEYTPGLFRFACALSGVATSAANLSALLLHVQHKLRCPLP
jgi:hypothetical protein